jgi:hypothetical protein
MPSMDSYTFDDELYLRWGVIPSMASYATTGAFGGGGVYLGTTASFFSSLRCCFSSCSAQKGGGFSVESVRATWGVCSSNNFFSLETRQDAGGFYWKHGFRFCRPAT